MFLDISMIRSVSYDKHIIVVLELRFHLELIENNLLIFFSMGSDFECRVLKQGS